MPSDFKTNVILCKWRKTAKGYHLWIKGRPGIFGEASSFEDAEKALTDAIWHAADDLDAVIPTTLEFDPPMPSSALAEPFLKPELYLVSGEGVFDVDSQFERVENHRDTRRERLFEYLATLYARGFCRTCKRGIGKRTDQSVRIRSYEREYDAGYVRSCYGFVGSYGRVFSDRFLALLHPGERDRLAFRPLHIAGKPFRRTWFELLGPSDVRCVGVKGLDALGHQCPACGSRCFSMSDPRLNQSGVAIHDFVLRSDLPHPLPSCFTVGDADRPELCLTRERWDRIRGRIGTSGVLTERLGVVSEERCVRRPRLWMGLTACDSCSQWPEPVTIKGKRRCVWDLPVNTRGAEGYDRKNLAWIRPAQSARLIRIVRQTIALDEMKVLIDSGKKPRRPEVISFRCPECWRLGRIILEPRSLSLSWS